MIFNKYIKKKISNYGYCLLLIDRYYNFINLDFFNYANKYQIIILKLFFYSIYQL